MTEVWDIHAQDFGWKNVARIKTSPKARPTAPATAGSGNATLRQVNKSKNLDWDADKDEMYLA